MYFVEEEPRGEAGGVQEQELSIGYLLPTAFCTTGALSGPFKLMQRQFDFRRDFVTLFIIHPVGVSYVGILLLLFIGKYIFSQVLVLNSSTFPKQWLCHRML